MGNSKQEIREMVRQKREALSPREATLKSSCIAEILLDFPRFKKAGIVGAFAAIRNEPDLRRMLERVMTQKKICFPVVEENEELEFYQINNYQELRAGNYEIPEPDKAVAQKMTKESFEVVLVPGIAFDANGYRIGYGKGYYDKFLAGIKAIKIGIAYDFQIVQAVPFEEHDLSMDYIITEKKVFFCRK